jgi:hypothetical protein
MLVLETPLAPPPKLVPPELMPPAPAAPPVPPPDPPLPPWAAACPIRAMKSSATIPEIKIFLNIIPPIVSGHLTVKVYFGK